MDITKRLQELDPTLILHNEGAWDKPLQPETTGYTSFNDAGIETETGEFLYAMVRLLKPERVLETGTHIGVGAAYMGQALKDNKRGVLDTIEFLPEIYNRAKKRIEDLKLESQVNLYFGDVASWQVPGDNTGSEQHFGSNPVSYKLILLDTEPQTRFNELVKFEPFLEEGGFVFIHDLHNHMHQIPNEEHGFAWPFGAIPQGMKALVAGGKLRPFHFPTPRGLTGFYKVSEKDYKWQ